MGRFLRNFTAILLILALMIPLTVFANDSEQAISESTAYEELRQTWFWAEWVDWQGFDNVEEAMQQSVHFWGMEIFYITAMYEAFGLRSAEDFMREYGLNEQQYLIIEQAWTAARESTVSNLRLERERLVQRRLEELRARGGTPGIVNVMINNRFMQFDGVVPETRDGVAFVPAAQFFTVLGYTVSFDAPTQSLTVERTGMSFRFVVGVNEIWEDCEHWGEWVTTIREAPYMRDGVVFVPVRSAAQVMGYNVFWDRELGVVIVIDRSQIVAEINRDFTIINRLLNMPINIIPSGNGTFETVAEMSVGFTTFNSLDGNSTAHLSMEFTGISDGRSSNMRGVLNLSELAELMLAADFADMFRHEDAAMILRVLNALDDAEIETILSGDRDTLYIRMPVISEFIPEVSANSWIRVSGISEILGVGGFPDFDAMLESFSISEMFGMTNIGEYATPRLGWRGRYGTIGMFDEIMQSAREEARFYGELFGDNRIIRRDGSYTLAITFDEYIRASERSRRRLEFDEFDVNVTVATSGGAISAASGNVQFRENSRWSDERHIFEFDISPNRVYLIIDYHERNAQQVRIEMDVVTSGVTTAVRTSPPAGARIVDIMELIEPMGASGLLWLSRLS